MTSEGVMLYRKHIDTNVEGRVGLKAMFQGWLLLQILIFGTGAGTKTGAEKTENGIESFFKSKMHEMMTDWM